MSDNNQKALQWGNGLCDLCKLVMRKWFVISQLNPELHEYSLDQARLELCPTCLLKGALLKATK